MILFTIIFVLVGCWIISLYNSLIAKPRQLRQILKKQGIDGPKPIIFLGNALEMKKCLDAAEKESTRNRMNGPPVIHDSVSVYPFLVKWRKQFGQVFLFCIGKVQMLCISNPDLMKEIATMTSMDLGSPSEIEKEFAPLFGRGIVTSNGPSWARQRKIMAPELYMDKVKGMMGIITESAIELIDSWKHEMDNCGEGVLDMKVGMDMEKFFGDVISKACFGSSYERGKEIFFKLGLLQDIIHKRFQSLSIPGLRHLPTKANRSIWSLEKEISALIVKVVNDRMEKGYEKDLLQILLESAKSSDYKTESFDQFVIDNCRNIYLAGFLTSTMAAGWCLMLLATNQEWQNRVRDEVREVCQGQVPDIEMIRKLKLLHMVIQETMRLYPSAPIVGKEVFKDMTIGNIQVPKGVHLGIYMPALHTDPELWGPDAMEFKPQRFENGISGACKSPSSYLPFGFGQRVCIGQNLVMVELKLLIALIVSNFSFTLSPKYVHAPVMEMVIHPKHGVNILLKKLY